jgi:hypothetical protein
MALAHSPKIVTNGLVFAYDMGNPQKSWIGRPTTNFVNASSVAINRYNNPGFSGTVFNTGETYKGMPIWETTFIPQDSSFISRLGSTEGFGAFHSMGTSLAVNNRYMASIYFRRISPLQNSPTLGFINTYSNIAGWGQNGTSTTRIDQNDGWIRLYSQYLNTSSTLSDNKFWKITFDTTGVQVGQTLRAQWCAPMIEQHDTVYPSTFVNGTRLNTQSILDLTNNNTLTANSLTYDNNGLFNFNGTSDFISTNFVGNSSTFTHEVFLRPTNVTKDQMYIGHTIGAHYVRIVNSRPFLSISTTSAQRTFSHNEVLINNNFYHIVSIYNGSRIKIYVNGVLNEGPILNEPLNGWGTNRIGRWQDGDQRSFVGDIFSLKSYNRELTASEVAQNFAALRGRYGI